MSIEPTTPLVILIKKGALSERGMGELRKAGYRVIQSENPESIKEFHAGKFNAASDRAKIKAFEYSINGGPPAVTQDGLRFLYVKFLRDEGAL